MTTWILIILNIGFVQNYSGDLFITRSDTYKEVSSQERGSYKIYKNKADLSEGVKDCQDKKSCEIIGLIGCDLGGCKAYNYELTTNPKITTDIQLKEIKND